MGTLIVMEKMDTIPVPLPPHPLLLTCFDFSVAVLPSIVSLTMKEDY